MPRGNPGIRRKPVKFCPNHPNKETRALSLCMTCYRKQYWTNLSKDERINYNLKKLPKKYKISLIEWQEMLKQQKQVCALCAYNFKRTPCVDHNHTTGEVRGLLCNRCNTLVGYLEKSSSEILIKILKYCDLKDAHLYASLSSAQGSVQLT